MKTDYQIDDYKVKLNDYLKKINYNKKQKNPKPFRQKKKTKTHQKNQQSPLIPKTFFQVLEL